MKYDKLNMKSSRVGERGQVTIPQPLRLRYGVGPGEEVVFEEHEDGLLIRRVAPGDPLQRLIGRVEEDLNVDQYLEDTRGPVGRPERDGG